MMDGSHGSFVRIVMVEFYPQIDELDIQAFRDSLERLAKRARGLLRMHCGSAHETQLEGGLNARAPHATFPHFASIWEFANQASLEEFINDAFHREMAKEQFSKFVKHRYVINIG